MPSAAAQVLVVGTNTALTLQMETDLQQAGYAPQVVTTAADALAAVAQAPPALIVIDRLAGSPTGLELCETLRAGGLDTPIVLLMARDNLEDRVACLQAGADDYFLKPYQTDGFLTIVHLYLKPVAADAAQLRFAHLTLDLASRVVISEGDEIELTMKEFELLKYLMQHPNEVLTRDQILENVWGYEFMGESNVIEVYIRYLRLKIDGDSSKRLIQTVRGVGYVLREA